MKRLFYQALTVTLLMAGLIACQKDDEKPALNPDAGSSFIDIENDGYVVTLGASAVRENETGIWRIYSGDNGRFEDVNDPKTKFFGEPGQSYLLGWELSNGDSYETSLIDVSFKKMIPVINNSLTDTITGKISLYLKAEEAKFGAVGKWEITSGEGGRIEQADQANAEFIGKAKETYTVSWTLTYGEAQESSTITFSTDEFTVFAGNDKLDIKTNSGLEDDKFFTLEGFLPAGATGMWEVHQGHPSTVVTANNPNSLFKGVADTSYTLIWNVELDGLTASDTVDIRFRGKWGTWIDERDGQTYRFCEINGLEWMTAQTKAKALVKLS
ncbi:MAG: hypothetical protein MI866_06215, partial [Bacteroidales bacterium]|nr:hypothetical protein [Bacteroidales bacterium]